MFSNLTNFLDSIQLQNPALLENITQEIKHLWKDEPLSFIQLLLALLLVALTCIAIIECVRAWKDEKRYTFQNGRGNELPMHDMQQQQNVSG